MRTEALLSSRPLSDSARDRALLLGRRDAVARVVKAVSYGLNILILGGRGVGKTSFLHTCEWELRHSEGRTTVWINGAFMESAVDLVDAVAYELQSPREGRPGGVAEQAALPMSAFAGSRQVYGAPDRVLAAIRQLGSRLAQKGEGREEPPRQVVIVDDLRPEVAHDLFGRARDELWSLPLVWIVAGDKARSADFLKPPADSFFGRVVELGPLSQADAHALLRSRAQERLPEDIARKMVAQAEGNPRRLITLATEALLDGADSAAHALERDRATTTRLRELGSSAQRLWEALLPMEQATANDPQLLDRLGWSRVRASQVLNQLESAGLVESSTEKARHGRPRKVYRVRMGSATS